MTPRKRSPVIDPLYVKDPPRAIRVKTSTGWADLAIQGPPGSTGPPGAAGPTGPQGPTGATGPPAAIPTYLSPGGQQLPGNDFNAAAVLNGWWWNDVGALNAPPVGGPYWGLHVVVAANNGAYLTQTAYDYGGATTRVWRRRSYAGTFEPWVQVSPVPYATTLPASPIDGQEAVLVDSVTAPTYTWRFRYNAGSSSAYKWEFVGGSEWFQLVGGSWTSTLSNTWEPLMTSVAFPAPRSGYYNVTIGFGDVNAPGNGGYYAFFCGIWFNGTMSLGAGYFHTSGSPAPGILTPTPTWAGKDFCAAGGVIRPAIQSSNANLGSWDTAWMRVSPVAVA